MSVAGILILRNRAARNTPNPAPILPVPVDSCKGFFAKLRLIWALPLPGLLILGFGLPDESVASVVVGMKMRQCGAHQERKAGIVIVIGSHSAASERE
jgi:hypothetical protein